ncbi:MAG: ATP-binding protein, partial [Paracoccaceae bacterium]
LVWARTRRHVVSRLGVVSARIVQLARGEPTPRMPISGHDEIGRLEKAINVLRRRMDEAAGLRASLEAAVLARTADVVAEMHSADAARAEAEGQSRAKTHFLARMSHEIRTPLNGVIGLLDLLVADEDDPARRARLGTALTSARDLQELADDILSFSSGEDGDAARLAAFDPARLAQGLGDHLVVLAQAKGLVALVDLPPELPAALVGDATRIRQVVVNLISNAVKYTDAGQVALRVTLRPAPDSVMREIAFAVTDTGPGMTAAETRQAFDIYGRTFDARRKGISGVGLGLAIVRQLTDAMGGELRVASTPGQGSSFTLSLRLALADPDDLRQEAAVTVPPGLRVLLVEDHPVNRLVARGYLQRMGCLVAEAETGAEALAAATAGQFDVMLIDLNLPDMRGEEVAARIARKGARLAALTADPVTDDPATRARLGVDHALTKPISPRALAAVLGGTAVRAETGAVQTEAILRDDLATLGSDLTVEIVSAFLADLAEAVPALLAAQGAEPRRAIAHRMKGAASNFALQDLCDLLHRAQSDETALPLVAAEATRAAAALRAAAARVGVHLSGTAKQ